MKMTLGQLVEGALSEADQQLKLASAADAHLPTGDDAIKVAKEKKKKEKGPFPYSVMGALGPIPGALGGAIEGSESPRDEPGMGAVRGAAGSLVGSIGGGLVGAGVGHLIDRGISNVGGAAGLPLQAADLLTGLGLMGGGAYGAYKATEKYRKPAAAATEKTSALDDAAYAQELVEALGHIQALLPKLASEMQTFKGPHNVGDTTKHSPTKPKTVSAAIASHGGGGSEAVDGGSRTGIQTNKTAALRETLARQALMLEAAGAKVAQDPSSPQPTGISTTSSPGKMDTAPGNASVIPDNQGLARMTKRQAKTRFVRTDAGKVLREPAFDAATDKSLRDNLSMGLETAKIAAGSKEHLPIVFDEDRQGRIGGAAMGTYGGLTGLGVGGILSDGKPLHTVAAGLGGAGLGYLGGRALGRWGARVARKEHDAQVQMLADQLRSKLQQGQQEQQAKTSSLQKAAKRALLVKIAAGSKEHLPAAFDEDKQGRIGGAIVGTYGGLTGLGVGGMLSRGKPLHTAAAGLGGAGLGYLGGKALGRWGARTARKEHDAQVQMLADQLRSKLQQGQQAKTPSQ